MSLVPFYNFHNSLIGHFSEDELQPWIRGRQAYAVRSNDGALRRVRLLVELGPEHRESLLGLVGSPGEFRGNASQTVTHRAVSAANPARVYEHHWHAHVWRAQI